MAASLASVPELQKNACPPKLRSESSLGPAALGFGVPGVGHVDQRGDLLLHGLDDRLGTMAQQVAAPAGKEVEIAIALGVPHVRAFAARQRHAEAPIVGHDVPLEQLDDFARSSWSPRQWPWDVLLYRCRDVRGSRCRERIDSQRRWQLGSSG